MMCRNKIMELTYDAASVFSMTDLIFKFPPISYIRTWTKINKLGVKLMEIKGKTKLRAHIST